MNGTRLPKTALEEAYEHPDDVKRILQARRNWPWCPPVAVLCPRNAGRSRLSSASSTTSGWAAWMRLASSTRSSPDRAAHPGRHSSGRGHRLARKQNDFLTGQVARHPYRYSGFAASTRALTRRTARGVNAAAVSRRIRA